MMREKKFDIWRFDLFEIIMGLVACSYLFYIYFIHYYGSTGRYLLGIILSSGICLFYFMFCLGFRDLKDRYINYKDYMKKMTILEEECRKLKGENIQKW